MKKKLENFWYYYKYYVLIALGVIAVLVWVYLPSNRAEEKFDYCIGIVSPVYYDDEQIDALKEALSATYGKTDVRCYHVQLGASGQDEIEISSLDMDLIAGTSKAFLVADAETFKEVVNAELSEAVPVSEIESLKGLGFDELSLISRLDY